MREAVKLKHAHGAVPQHGARTLQRARKRAHAVRADVQSLAATGSAEQTSAQLTHTTPKMPDASTVPRWAYGMTPRHQDVTPILTAEKRKCMFCMTPHDAYLSMP